MCPNLFEILFSNSDPSLPGDPPADQRFADIYASVTPPLAALAEGLKRF
jgi:hypothetical protein